MSTDFNTDLQAQPSRAIAPEMDLDEARRFLRLLDPNATTFTFQTFHDTKARETDRSLARIIEVNLNDPADPGLLELLELYRRGAGVWVAVNETDGRGRTSDNVVRFRDIWQEDDDGFDGEIPLDPSVVVATSPGKYHRHFLTDWPADELGRRDHAAVLNRMVESYGSDNDAKGPNRVLRVPGFLNRKYGAPFMVHITTAPGHRYTRAEILQAFPPIERKPKAGNGAANGSGGTTYTNFTRDDATELERARDALRYIPADDRATWISIGMALEDRFGERGRPLWDEWSATSTKYNDDDQPYRWGTFKGKGTTINTLFGLARQAGWKPADETIIEDLIRENASGAAAEERRDYLESTTAAIYELRALDWLWPNRFALGKLGLIVGLPDKGKGLITYSVIACVTSNYPLPCNEGRAPQGRVILLQAEDDLEDTVIPRLMAAGVDRGRVEIINMVRTGTRNARSACSRIWKPSGLRSRS
jgi:hypothetical protein